jgi:hypothetical protein
MGYRKNNSGQLARIWPDSGSKWPESEMKRALLVSHKENY